MTLLQPGSQGDASLVDEGTHCMKSIQIRSFFWSVFSRIWMEVQRVLTGLLSDQKNRSTENIILRGFSSMYRNTKTLVTGPYY